ncbi:MAG: excinuclease ABC subunit UvrB, partial [Bacteroidetes bacterium]|nr:excinuclease ABC subunit UvrB [Bacteroidota bacterium]
MPKHFNLESSYSPAGDQPQAIAQLTEGLLRGDKFQTLLGVTGSGKTFTMSNVIANTQRPTLVISPNKTLAAQLYGEFRQFFPQNAVEFFISYYDYYQPEAYLPTSDTYIEKDFAINDEIDRLRLRATSALVEERRDVIVVASVSCIYGIGTRESFAAMTLTLQTGKRIERKDLIRRLVDMYYSRNDFEWQRGTFRVRGDIIDVMPAYEETQGIRIEMFGDEIERLSWISRTEGKILENVESITFYPARQFVSTAPELARAMGAIRDELHGRLKELRSQDKLLEAQRLEQRTLFDLEMLKEVGYCSGVENYSMHIAGRNPGERPSCLFDYFPKDFLLILDESHVTIPQLRAMYNGDRMRKQTLVEHGFRLPSALDNRPMKFDEIESLIHQTVFVSATPGDYELQQCKGVIVEQVIRPTGLLDPCVETRPVKTQIDDLLREIRLRIAKGERTLVTTLTKRMAEDLAEYLAKLSVRVAYIHSEIDALERVEILRNLRLGDYDVLVGVNLLREGLDMPEVSLVAILDADKEGFLRSEKSLMQVAGRAARNVNGLVILYADKITRSMQTLISETARRREIQTSYNQANGINPATVYKSVEEILRATTVADIQEQRGKRINDEKKAQMRKAAEPILKYMTDEQREELVEQLFTEMKNAAHDLDFERAAELRDEIQRLQLL